uniref:ImmA/IrrE family metallo-endopeptidase n=1 Tax=Roseburia faecis TaxID=301302 RepID=UPI0040272158
MNKFEKLCQTASDIDVDIVDYPFTSNRFKGLYCDGTLALNQDICADSEKACILAEELGHHFTTVGNITDQKETENRKQERRARVWAYHKLLSLDDLIDSYKFGCRNKFEIAEHLNVTEDFLVDCLEYYKEKYGLYVRQDNYLIYFEPLGILEMMCKGI